MKNKKGQLSKTGFILGLSIFYSVLIVFLGVVDLENIDSETQTIDTAIEDSNVTTDAGFFSILSNIGIFKFFGNVITGIGAFPIWLNSIIFAPLIITLIYLIVTSLPTFNGGG